MPTFASRKGLLKSNKQRKLSILQGFQRTFAQEFVASNDANRGTNRATPDEIMTETFNTDAEDSLDEQMMIPSFWYERMTAPITLVLMTS
jgi:hypothetical protein